MKIRFTQHEKKAQLGIGEAIGAPVGATISTIGKALGTAIKGAPYLLALGPAVGGTMATAETYLGAPSKTDFSRLRKKDLIQTYNRLAAEAEQRARQMKGEQD